MGTIQTSKEEGKLDSSSNNNNNKDNSPKKVNDDSL